MKSKLTILLVLALFSLSLFSCSKAPQYEEYDLKRTIDSNEAIEIAKEKFEFTNEHYNESGFTKVYSPSYGSCDAYLEGSYWIVTLRGNYKGYKDKFASGELYTQNFQETFYINVLQ